MDPTTTLAEILAALTPDARTGEIDQDTAVDGLRYLADWLARGGVGPNVAEAIEATR